MSSPPLEETDRLLWTLAIRADLDHRPDQRGRCVCCHESYPCLSQRAAEESLRLVLDHVDHPDPDPPTFLPTEPIAEQRRRWWPH